MWIWMCEGDWVGGETVGEKQIEKRIENGIEGKGVGGGIKRHECSEGRYCSWSI